MTNQGDGSNDEEEDSDDDDQGVKKFSFDDKPEERKYDQKKWKKGNSYIMKV